MADVEPALKWIEPGTQGVEIGVSFGDSAKAMLEHGCRFLWLVDPWGWYPDYREDVPVDPVYWEGVYRQAMDRLSPWAGKHAHLRMASAEAVKYIPPPVDFVWVDGNHRYEWVKSDCELYWPLIRPGGVLCGHDFTDNATTCQVKRAVFDFLGALPAGHYLELALPCWAIRKGGR